MKKKYLIRIGIIVGILLGLWFTLRITGVIQFYKVPTTRNLPTIKPDQTIFISNLKSYKRLDYVGHYQNNPKFEGGIWVSRICGLPGDKIEIVNGTLFVNGNNIDKVISVMHDYFVSRADGQRMQNNYIRFTEVNADTVRISIEDKVARKINARRFIIDEIGYLDPGFKNSWTLDNFGPIIVPKGKLFVVGDNRHNSVDSRITGYVNEVDVVGVVIW